MVLMFAMSAVLLAGGVEGFARGAEKLGVPPRFRVLLTGLSFALPALLVAFVAGFGSYPKLAVAVLLGNCIANVGFVLSLSTLARPFEAKNPQLRPTIPMVIVLTLLVWFLARDNELNRLDAGVLLAAGIGCAVVLVGGPPAPRPASQPFTGSVLALAGLGWAAGAAVLLVRACSDQDGLIPASGIGGTAFALAVLGPALALRGVAAGVVAARTGDGDTALAGVVCGSIVTLFAGFGILAIAKPLVVIETVQMNVLPAAAIAPLFLIAVRMNNMTTRRWDAVLQLAAYAGFVAWMVSVRS